MPTRSRSGPVRVPDTDGASEGRVGRSGRLLVQAAETTDQVLRRRLLDETVLSNMGVARSVAARYRRHGLPDDDLEHVAYLGLTKAVHSFDPSYERDFLAYAVTMIRAEIRMHLRDRVEAVRPPSRIREQPS